LRGLDKSPQRMRLDFVHSVRHEHGLRHALKGILK
jgi:hypothetical protein